MMLKHNGEGFYPLESFENNLYHVPGNTYRQARSLLLFDSLLRQKDEDSRCPRGSILWMRAL